MIDALCDLDARVVCFPVRHHSPACARRVREVLERLRPAAVLIEGPSDFNDRIAELQLPHRLPIAIYSFVRLTEDRRRGAYYPFCIYSPEWQAMQAAWQLGAAVRFIDLPWADIARVDEVANRYADRDLRRGEYVRRLCRQVGVETFDDLWDELFELDGDWPLEEFLRRCHSFCLHSRLLDAEVRLSDRRREAYMAGEVERALEEFSGRILVVTGGYHSSAILARLAGASTDEPARYEPQPLTADGAEWGVALTPYSYERLDSLRGYEAGMPNPGFYHQVWQDRQEGLEGSHRRLLAQVVRVLRQRKQQISAADLIAAETTAGALAQLRGHGLVWRKDLVDGMLGALIKEERALGMGHPLLEAIHEVFRGGARGLLAEGTVLPPLVQDLRRLLHEHDLEPQPQPRELDIDLHQEGERQRSQVLHRLRILAIAGYDRAGGTDLTIRDDLSKVWERWRVRWSPDHDASSIEAARYGPTLAEAAAARLAERSSASERNAVEAAHLLFDASLAGLTSLADAFLEQLAALIRGDSDFISVAKALEHLLYLYVYDHVLQTGGRPDLANLTRETFTRSLWLLESLGQTAGRDRELLAGIRTVLDAFERCSDRLGLERTEFVAVLGRVGAEKRQSPVVRGAALGVLWTVGECNADQVRSQLRFFADPDQLGDFLTGLFCLAREVAQRQRELVLSIDQLLAAYADEEFLTALPALRLAFTYFTPREKHYMAQSLLEALGLKTEKSMTRLQVAPETAARALAFETRLFEAVARYGLRGGGA